MIARIARFRPTRSTLSAITGLIWAVSFGALRDFVWADLREGMIDLRSMPRVLRALTVIGFALMLAMIAVLLFADLWRAQFNLIALHQAVPGRGSLIPSALIPVTMFLFAVSWTFTLAGAIHSHPLVRVPVLVAYLILAGQWLVFSLSTSINLWALAAFFSLGLTLLFFLVRWKGRPRPGLEFGVLMALVGTVSVATHTILITQDQLTGLPMGIQYLTFTVMTLSSATMPLLLMIGVDIANFTRQAAGWAVEIVKSRLPKMALYGLLALALAMRVVSAIQETADTLNSQTVRETAAAYAGALGEMVVLGAVVLALLRLRRTDEPVTPDEMADQAESKAVWLILLYTGPALIAFVILVFAPLFAIADIALGLFSGTGPAGGVITNLLTDASGWLSNQALPAWRILLEAAALGFAFWLMRRGRTALALYLGVFGARMLWYALTNHGAPLEMLYWEGPRPFDFWLVVLLAAVCLFWIARRAITVERTGSLLFLVLLSGLLRQTDFIENPFSFAFAGVGLIAFGLFWDTLTGCSWANTGSAVLPRSSRIFLYLGYVLLTTLIVNWSLATHDLYHIELFTGDLGVTGLDVFGRPMLYALFPLMLLRPENGEK